MSIRIPLFAADFLGLLIFRQMFYKIRLEVGSKFTLGGER